MRTGVQLVLWTTCVTYLWKERKRGWNIIFLICYLCLLLSIQFIFSIVQARTIEIMYIDNRNYPGGPWRYFLNTPHLAVNGIFYITFHIGTFLCDLLVVRPKIQKLTKGLLMTSNFSFGGAI